MTFRSLTSEQYFRTNPRITPQHNCLFYSGNGEHNEGLSDQARAFAQYGFLAPMTTIWVRQSTFLTHPMIAMNDKLIHLPLQDVWTCDHYNDDVSDTNNRLRGIFSDPVTQRTYFENMSRAVAYLCSGDAMVMVDLPPYIPPLGIFFRVEFPQLVGNISPNVINRVSNPGYFEKTSTNTTPLPDRCA